MQRINARYSILTPTGYKPFLGIKKIYTDYYLEIKFVDNTTIKCSEGHKLYSPDGTVCRAITLCAGQEVWGKDSTKVVAQVSIVNSPIWLYDAVEVDDGHKYYTGNIVSSNCDASFLTSGDTVFETDDLLFYEQTYQKDPVEKRGIDGNYWIWENPDYSRTYMVIADVARGDGTDYSTAHVMDVESATQVAEYKGKLSPRDFGNVLVGIASEYNDALLVVENASIGWSTVEQILARDYKNLYYSSKSNMETVESYMAKYERDRLVPGFTTSMQTRPLVIAKFMEYVRDRSVVIHSKRLLGEMRVFIWKNGKAQAQTGYNDDLVMAFAIGLYVRDTALRLRQQGLDLARAQLSTLSTVNAKNPAILSTASPMYGPNPYIQKTAHGEEDITWVLK